MYVNLTDIDFYDNEDYYYFSLVLEAGKLEYLRTDRNLNYNLNYNRR